MGAPQWYWELLDASGSTIAGLETASGRSLSFKRNTYAEATFTLSHEDEAAQLLFDALANTGVPKLRCYRRAEGSSSGVVKFRGPLVDMEDQAGEASIVTARFRSPFGVLLGDGDSTGRYFTAEQSYEQIDAGVIAKRLLDIANADSPTGLSVIADEAVIPRTKPRDRHFATGTNIGQAIFNLSSLLDGFDFFETFVDGAGTTDAMLNIVASQGSDNPAARFEYGPTTLANVREARRLVDGPRNVAFVIGNNGLTATYTDQASVDKYGKWYHRMDYADVIEQSTLDDKARAIVRPDPIKTIKFTPDAALAPRLFDDYNLGDTVRFLARRGALQEDTALRINGASLVLDDAGFEATETEDPTTPGQDAVLRASLSAEIVDS